MALGQIKLPATVLKVAIIAGAVIVIALGYYFARWNFANMVASQLDVTRPEAKIVVDRLIDLGPDDPQTHFTAAALFEKTFDANDLARSLSEYEAAAALNPNNYLMWINLGRARYLNGDTSGAANAYAEALKLAPNYAFVKWTYGNFMIREGQADKGFALIAQAATANADYAKPAVVTALEFYDSDAAKVRSLLGDSAAVNSALASAQADGKHFDEAVESWARIPAADRTESIQKLGENLAGLLAQAKRYQLAARVAGDLAPEGEKPAVGQIANGGFETGVKLRGAGLFEWQIGDGTEPQVGLSDAQKHDGKFSLVMTFNSTQTTAFRSISHAAAVEPGASYQLKLFYRYDVKSDAHLKWEVADASTAAAIAATPAMTMAGDWTTLTVDFKVPQNIDGITVRLARDGCGGPICPMSGRVTIDDVSIRKL